jgi:hypothetical protein
MSCPYDSKVTKCRKIVFVTTIFWGWSLLLPICNPKQNWIHQLLIVDITRRMDSIMNCRDKIEVEEIKWMLIYLKEYLIWWNRDYLHANLQVANESIHSGFLGTCIGECLFQNSPQLHLQRLICYQFKIHVEIMNIPATT